MPKGYWIVRVDLRDPEAYKGYVAAAGQALAPFGAKMVVAWGTFENPEGTARPGNVVVEFQSLKAARDCYYSPAYQAAKAIRDGCAEADLIIVEGV